MHQELDPKSYDLIFNKARTFSEFESTPVSQELLEKVYNLTKMGPTSANCCPMRVVFVQSQEAKEKLKPALAEGNVEKTMKAPVTAIIAHDMEFYNQLPKLYPHTDARAWFEGNAALIESTAFRNGTLQGAYLILAARSCGLDCGPMSGFENAKVDEAFFAGTAFKSNFLINLGYGKKDSLHPRSPRLSFQEVCKVL